MQFAEIKHAQQKLGKHPNKSNKRPYSWLGKTLVFTSTKSKHAMQRYMVPTPSPPSLNLYIISDVNQFRNLKEKGQNQGTYRLLEGMARTGEGDSFSCAISLEFRKGLTHELVKSLQVVEPLEYFVKVHPLPIQV